MIVEQRDRPGWFLVDTKTGAPLVRVFELSDNTTTRYLLPGVKAYDSRRLLVHRSHLPLLDDPEALNRIAPRFAPDWAARDTRFAELGIKPRTTQHQAIDFIRDRVGTLLGDDMRLGKGHPVDTGVLTPRGWRVIGSLKVGDEVFGADGEPHAVTGVFPRGRLPIFKVTFSDGVECLVDGDHLWTAWDHNAWHRGQRPSTVQTRDLIGDLKYSNGNRKWRIPMVKPIVWPHVELPLDPYVVGVLLGDGSFARGSVTFCPGDEDVPEEVRKVLPATVKLTRHAKMNDKATIWGIVGLQHGNNPVLDLLRDWGLLGLKSERKFVPFNYLRASIEQRIALLQGLMDTDGELWASGTVGFSSASRSLTTAVQHLVEGLGGSTRWHTKQEPKYKYRGEERTGLPSHRLTIAMPDGISPFRARIGYQSREKFKPARLIESIEPCGEADVMCISVDATDQLYVTERHVVTHNTLSAVASHDPTLGKLVVVAPLATRAVWLNWIRKVFPGWDIGLCIGRKFNADVFDKPIVFGHYDIIHQWQSIGGIGTLVLDEAHALTKRTSRRSEAAVLLARWAKRVIALTGTPIWRWPSDLWSVISMVVPGAWGNYYEFCERYGDPKPTAYGKVYDGLSNGDELNRRLSDVMLRRRWVDCSNDLPPITRSVIVAEVSQAESNKLDILAGKLKSDRTNTAGHFAAYRRQVSTIKLSTVVREAKRVMDAGEPVVIWTWHKEYAGAIAGQLPGSFMIHGDVAITERDRRIDAWRAQPNSALIATLAVAGAGIDLSHALGAIFAEIDYTPAIIGQAEMRPYDPSRAMWVLFVVANHIVDQRIVRALVSKLGAADPLGVGAAVDAIDALRDAVMGPDQVGDLDRLLADLIASAE